VHLRVAPGAGGLGHTAYTTAPLGRDAVAQLIAKRSLAAPQPSQRNPKIVQRVGRALVVERLVCGPSGAEMGERNASRGFGRGSIERVGWEREIHSAAR